VQHPAAGEPASGERGQRGEQGERGEDGEQHRDAARPGEGLQQRHLGQAQPRERDHDRRTGERHRRAGVGDRAFDGLGYREARPRQRAEPAEQEQRVVDADAEADHESQGRRHGGHRGQVPGEAHDLQRREHREPRGQQRQHRADQATEREEQHDGGQDEAEVLVAGASGAVDDLGERPTWECQQTGVDGGPGGIGDSVRRGPGELRPTDVQAHREPAGAPVRGQRPVPRRGRSHRRHVLGRVQ
jgi:hypothetical protein